MAAVTPEVTLNAPDIRTAKRLVVKIGSALLVDRKTGLKQNWLSALALDVAEAKTRGTDVVLVSTAALPAVTRKSSRPTGSAPHKCWGRGRIPRTAAVT